MIAMFGLGGGELTLLLLAIIFVVLLLTVTRGSAPTVQPVNRTGKLYRSNQDSRLAGVCGGLAEYLGWHSGRVRIVWVLATIFTAFTGVVIYVMLWFLMPVAPPPAPEFPEPPLQPWNKTAKL